MTLKTRDQCDAALAAVLAAGARAGRLQASDALRVIKHEMRRRNTNKKGGAAVSIGKCARVIDEYERRGLPMPINAISEARVSRLVQPFDELVA